MNTLLENSIMVEGDTVACHPQFGESTFNVDKIGAQFNNCYATSNSTVCFIVDRKIYVTPATRQVMATLKAAGLTEKSNFVVPFDNGSYPKEAQKKWKTLRDAQILSRYHDYEVDCMKYCDEHGIGEISSETMRRCLKIPRGGIPVNDHGYKFLCKPECSEFFVDSIDIEMLGKYCSNGGKVAFIYRDGHTYVAKGNDIINELRQAGYTEKFFYVPFSKSEQITDPYWETEWAKKTEK